MSFGTNPWTLSEGLRRGEVTPSEANNHSLVLAWLRGFKSNAPKMAELRALLARTTPRDLSQQSDDDVVDGILLLIARGRLCISAPPRAPLPKIVGAPPPPAPPALPSLSRPPAMPRLPKLEPPLFPNIDVAGQVTMLVAAAATGAPFCPI